MKNYLLLFVLLTYQFSLSNVVVPPIANSIGNQQICDEGPLMDGVDFFDLTSYSPLILQGNPAPLSNYLVSFYVAQSDAINNVNAVSNPSSFSGTNGQTIWVRVTDSTTSEYSLTNFGLVVNLPPAIVAPSNPLMTCDFDGVNDGFTFYDLSVLTTEILNGLSASNYTVGFYETQNAVNPIQNASLYYASTRTIWCSVANNSTGCESSVSFNLIVEQLPEPFITNQANTICVDYLSNTVETALLLESSNMTSYLNAPQVPVPDYWYQWYMNGVLIAGANSPNFLIASPLSDNSSAVFTVEMNSMTAGGCTAISEDFVVYQSGQASPIGIGYSIVNNSGNQIITVEIEGYGVYQYSLDGGQQQDSPIFENVSLGTHTITVWDIEGGPNYSCNPLLLSNIEVIAAPLPPPTGNASQSFSQGATLADIQVSGENIRWYETNTSVIPLPMNTVLVNGSTYFATQKVGGYESVARLAVTVQTTLNNVEFNKNDFLVSPNPVVDNLKIKSDKSINNIQLYNLLGQVVYEQNSNQIEVEINLSFLKSGSYLMRVQSEGNSSSKMILKN
ncbi:T9SS type A sorting domain-containing protein [Flavobacterium sp.]|uniref:T9SS type A sorting domain-containing protein n=1 Tax=Flavobacterium sp. TaxID=239 RepID=UPI002B4B6FE9|nr:T9SS type A sorting domain-containing protein [Flavobacterium sp.]HLP65672.1 T9SS type A sorting domain-containing protein [Flavobacterium sp.]